MSSKEQCPKYAARRSFKNPERANTANRTSNGRIPTDVQISMPELSFETSGSQELVQLWSQHSYFLYAVNMVHGTLGRLKYTQLLTHQVSQRHFRRFEDRDRAINLCSPLWVPLTCWMWR